MTLKEYKEDIEYLAKNKVDLIFPNSSPFHATIVLSNIIRYSNSVVSIYDNSLDGDLLLLNEEFPKSIEEASSKKRINIFLENEDNINKTLLADLKDKNVSIFIASNKFKEKVRKSLGGNFYFAVGDNSMFRIESSVNERKAMCSFNNSEYPTILSNIVRKTIDNCEKI